MIIFKEVLRKFPGRLVCWVNLRFGSAVVATVMMGCLLPFASLDLEGGFAGPALNFNPFSFVGGYCGFFKSGGYGHFGSADQFPNLFTGKVLNSVHVDNFFGGGFESFVGHDGLLGFDFTSAKV